MCSRRSIGCGVRSGAVTVFVQHTSCSLLVMENADPTARRDLEAFFDRLVPEDADYFTHDSEGSDDMPSHIRMALTRTSETIPIADGKMQLGTWQGIFLFEHRRAPHRTKNFDYDNGRIAVVAAVPAAFQIGRRHACHYRSHLKRDDKSRPPIAAIFHSAKAIAPFDSSRTQTRFYFQDRQRRGCRPRRDVRRKFVMGRTTAT